MPLSGGEAILLRVQALLAPPLVAPPLGGAPAPAAQDKDTLEWLYKGLNILDGKANGLLRVNALFLTLAGIAIAYFKGKPAEPLWLPVICLLIFALLFLASSFFVCS